MAKSDLPRIAVLGAGPIGLEAALYARHLQFPVTVFERGRIGEHLQRWGHLRLFSPFNLNATSLGKSAIRSENSKHEFPAEADCITGREHHRLYLEPLAKTESLRDCLRLETQVLYVGRHGFFKSEDPGDSKRARQSFHLLVKDKNGERAEEAEVVLDCTGTYGQHRWLGDGGIPALGETAAEPHIAYGLEDVLGDRRAHYAGKNIVVIGAGYSAATTVCNLASLAENHSDTWVTWLTRRSATQPIKRIVNDPLRERDRLAVRANTLATRGEGNVEFQPQCVIEKVEGQGHEKGFRLSGKRGGKAQTWEVDRVIANVGYTPDSQIYRELQVHECYASLGPMNLAAILMKQAGADCLQISGQGSNSLRNPEPNFFILGSKSYGRNSLFLLKAGFEQIRDVFSLLTGKPELDLYKKP